MHNTSTHSTNYSQDKKKEKKKRNKERKRTLLSFFFNLNFLFVATRVALIPRDRFCGIAARWSYKIIPADKVNFFCANNALQILSFSELTLEFSKPLRYFSQRTTERCISKPRFFFFFLSFFLFSLSLFMLYFLQDNKNSSTLRRCDVSPCPNAQVTALSSTEKLARHNIVEETIFLFF